MKFFWGFLFICLGFWALLNNFSFWNKINFDYLVFFWPLLVIIFGISIIVRHLRYGWLIVFLSFLVSIGIVLMFSLNSSLYNRLNVQTFSNSFSENLPDAVTKGEVKIESGASKITVGSSNEKFIEGNLESNLFEPELKITKQDNIIRANISTLSENRATSFRHLNNNLYINITNRIPVTLNVDSGASDLNLDLSKLILSRVNLNIGASSLSMSLGDNITDGAEIVIKSGASSLGISVPQSIGVRANLEGGLSSKDLNGFKDLGNGTYESDNYGSSTKKITVNIDAGVSSIKITRS